jgi:hypothetical protein
MCVTERIVRPGNWHSDTCPQGHRSLSCAYLASAALEGHCLTCNVGRQAGKSRGGLPIIFRTVDLVGTDPVPERGFPVLIQGDFNAKHRDWNSRLTTEGRSLLCDYANRNSTTPYNSKANPKYLGYCDRQGLRPTGASGRLQSLSSDHLLVLINKTCRTSFHDHLDCPDFIRTD